MNWRKNFKVTIYFLMVFLTNKTLLAEEFPYDPPENFVLKPDYIGLHHPVKTNQILAQLYFDQGLTFLYAFNHDAAYWSFLRASQTDPEMPMAYWGMALSLGENINMGISDDRGKKAYHAIQKALTLTADRKGVEKDYIEALARRYSLNPDADQKQLALDYSLGMKELSKKYPDDLDATVLFAESILDTNPWNQWTLDGKPLKGTEEALKALSQVLKKDPKHLGANHYFIHTIETSPHPEIGLMSAERLKTLLPSSGHILHMPSHIYLQVGDYLEAARSNEAAIAADREYIRLYGPRGVYPIHYLSHNLYVLSRAYTMMGRPEDALRASKELSDLYLSYFKSMPELEYFNVSNLSVLLTFHRWDELLALPSPDNDMLITKTLWLFGRSLAFAHLNDLDQSKKEQRLFLEAKAKFTQEDIFGYNQAEKILSIAKDCLESKLAEVQGDSKQALTSLEKAIAEQDVLRYNEPPDWFYPIRESMGGLLFRLRKFSDAELVFREELKRHPRNGRAIFGLKESLRAQSKMDDYYWVNREFEQAWKNSSIKLQVNDL